MVLLGQTRAEMQASMDRMNARGDAALFEAALVNGKLSLFNAKKIVLFTLLVPFCFIMLVFALLALELVFLKGIGVYLVPGLVALVISLVVPFLFFYEDKRILKEARRRNQFVGTANIRWLISASLFICIIILSLVVVYLLVTTGNNFVALGSLVSN